MPAFAKRVHPRIHYEIPIQYAAYQADGYEVSKMFNFSKGGLYFEPSSPLGAEARIRIRMLNHIPGSFGPEGYQIYVARIRWCREIPKPGPAAFGVGAEFLEKFHNDLDDPAPIPCEVCALCGMLAPQEMLRRFAEDVCLCTHCDNHLQGIPDGRILESINRFMIGNAI